MLNFIFNGFGAVLIKLNQINKNNSIVSNFLIKIILECLKTTLFNNNNSKVSKKDTLKKNNSKLKLLNFNGIKPV
jgi:hypothetical protein